RPARQERVVHRALGIRRREEDLQTRRAPLAAPRRHRRVEPVVKRWQRGFSLIEMLVALAIFALFIATIGILTYEMYFVQKKWPVNYMTHPDVGGVVARVRRDVLDS